MQALEQQIDVAWERRADLSPANADAATREAVEAALAALESGERRVAEPDGNGGWTVNQWLKKAVLLSFRLNPNRVMAADPAPFPAPFSAFSAFSAVPESPESSAASGAASVSPAPSASSVFSVSTGLRERGSTISSRPGRIRAERTM